MTKIEKKFIDFIYKHLFVIFIIIVSLMAIFIRINFFDFESGDYNWFLHDWFSYLKNHGGIHALSNYPGDYNAPYVTIMALLTYIPIKDLYLIKLVSVVFDFALAIASCLLVKELCKKYTWGWGISLLTYAIILFLPNVIMNGALWAQCDSIYTTFVILSLLFLIKKKYVLSFIMLGISFSFKLQFMFIFPLYIVLYFLKKDFSILHFLLIPIINFVMCLPAILMGKPMVKCMFVYFNQTQTYKDKLVLNFNNLYNLLPGNSDMFYKFGELITIFVCCLSLFYIMYKKINFNEEKMLTLGLWFIVITTFLLPGMHERYLFLGEVLSIILLIIYKKHLKLAIFINLSAIVNYSSFLFGFQNKYMWLMSLVYLFLIVEFTKNTFDILNEKGSKVLNNEKR